MKFHDNPDDIDYLSAEELQIRRISDKQIHKFEGYAAEIFSAARDLIGQRGPFRAEEMNAKIAPGWKITY